MSELLANKNYTLKYEVIEFPQGTIITPVDVTSLTVANKVDTLSSYVDAPINQDVVISSIVTIIATGFSGFTGSGTSAGNLVGSANKVKVDNGQVPLRVNDSVEINVTGTNISGATQNWVIRATIDLAGQTKVNAE